MEQNGYRENGLVLTNGEIEKEMLGRIAAPSIRSIMKENERLTETLLFLEDAVSFGGIDKWMWIRSVIYLLTDTDRRDDFMKRIPPENNLHASYPEIKKFGKYLAHWRKAEVLRDQHPVRDAISILSDRLDENMQILG
jgi:hypothetical protein